MSVINDDVISHGGNDLNKNLVFCKFMKLLNDTPFQLLFHLNRKKNFECIFFENCITVNSFFRVYKTSFKKEIFKIPMQPNHPKLICLHLKECNLHHIDGINDLINESRFFRTLPFFWALEKKRRNTVGNQVANQFLGAECQRISLKTIVGDCI